MAKVLFNMAVFCPELDRLCGAGQICEVSEETAKRYIGNGYAIEAKEGARPPKVTGAMAKIEGVDD